MLQHLYLADTTTSVDLPPGVTDPDAPPKPSPGPGADPDVQHEPAMDDVPGLPDQEEEDALDRPGPDPEMPDPKESDA